MGYALITGGGTDARYTIQLDYGEAQRVALVEAATQVVAQLNQQLLTAQTESAAADTREAAIRLQIEEVFESLVQASQEGVGFGDVAIQAYTFFLEQLYQEQIRNAPVRAQLLRIKGALKHAQNRLALWTELDTLDTRQAWCADFTEGLGGYVGTIDIPGESSLILIKPASISGAWAPEDGVLTARELMSPAQVYFNAAILPGWQIDKPTYRWGTLTAIDWDANTGNVTLGEARSSAQSLDVNRNTSLSNVQFDYMQTDARAFNNDSRVVVKFVGQDWASPRIIGFLDNPRPDPPTFDEDTPIPTFQFFQGGSASYPLSSYWAHGAEPREYSVIQGALPSGISLDPDTGSLSGEPSATATATIVVRCADGFYDEAKNRRLDDSNEFDIETFAGWTFHDLSFPDADSDVFQGLPFAPEDAWAKITVGGHLAEARVNANLGGDPETVLYEEEWFEGWDEVGAPNFTNMYVKLTPSTDVGGHYSIPGGQPDNDWFRVGDYGVAAQVWFSTDLSPPGDGILVINYSLTILISTAPAGGNIVSTITASGKLEYHPT